MAVLLPDKGFRMNFIKRVIYLLKSSSGPMSDEMRGYHSLCTGKCSSQVAGNQAQRNISSNVYNLSSWHAGKTPQANGSASCVKGFQRKQITFSSTAPNLSFDRLPFSSRPDKRRGRTQTRPSQCSWSPFRKALNRETLLQRQRMRCRPRAHTHLPAQTDTATDRLLLEGN